jgi:hypothetical protein
MACILQMTDLAAMKVKATGFPLKSLSEKLCPSMSVSVKPGAGDGNPARADKIGVSAIDRAMAVKKPKLRFLMTFP